MSFVCVPFFHWVKPGFFWLPCIATLSEYNRNNKTFRTDSICIINAIIYYLLIGYIYLSKNNLCYYKSLHNYLIQFISNHVLGISNRNQ